jgi:hypothetical protein
VGYSLSQFVVVSVSMQHRHVVVMFVVSHLLYAGCLWLLKDLLTGAYLTRVLTSSVVYWLFDLWSEESRRKRWRLDKVHQNEMMRLDYIMRDLLPVDHFNSLLEQQAGGSASSLQFMSLLDGYR